MISSRGQNTEHIAAVVAVLIVCLRLAMIFYGAPYSFHPDEVYIYKAPFKILTEYMALDFRTPTNLFYWVLTLWYGVGFLVGFLLGFFDSAVDFQHALLREDFVVFLWGRLFSVVTVGASLWVAWRICRLVAKGAAALLLFLLFAFNPIEWVANGWLKFDPVCYLVVISWFYTSFRYFFQADPGARWHTYLLAAIGFCTRIDLVLLIVMTSIGELLILKRQTMQVAKWICVALACYAFVTLQPLVFIAAGAKFQSGSSPSFEEAIVSKYVHLISDGTLIKTVWENFVYYFLYMGMIVMGPVLGLLTWSWLKPRKVGLATKYYLSFFIVYLLLILPFPYLAPHYFLIPSLLLMCILASNVSAEMSVRTKWTFFFLVAYASTQVVGVAVWVLTKKDTRLTARDYLINNSDSGDKIALEGMMNNGFFPPVSECPFELHQKGEALKSYHLGSGEGYRLKSLVSDTTGCRKLLELTDWNRFEGVPFRDRWVNHYDTIGLTQENIKWIALGNSLVSGVYIKSFETYVNLHFSSVKEVRCQHYDPRVQLLFDRENYFPEFFLYKRLSSE